MTMTISSILLSKGLCRDVIGIIHDYLVGNREYWKKRYTAHIVYCNQEESFKKDARELRDDMRSSISMFYYEELVLRLNKFRLDEYPFKIRSINNKINDNTIMKLRIDKFEFRMRQLLRVYPDMFDQEIITLSQQRQIEDMIGVNLPVIRKTVERDTYECDVCGEEFDYYAARSGTLGVYPCDCKDTLAVKPYDLKVLYNRICNRDLEVNFYYSELYPYRKVLDKISLPSTYLQKLRISLMKDIQKV